MIPTIPWYIELIVLAINPVVAVAVWSILSSAAGRSGISPVEQRRVRIGAGVFLGAWLGAALLLAPAPQTLLSRDPSYLTPLVPLFAVVPISLGLLAIGLSPALRQVLAAASLPAIVGVQLYRAVGVVFLILLAQGQLPEHFALPAGWGDIAVGLSAPLVALALARGARRGRTLALAWNGFGLVDLVVAVGMGSGLLVPLLAPQLGANLGPASAMGVFPLILVPTFAVPVSVLLHLIALGRLRSVKRASRLVPRTAS
jgi:hypothetical protein